MTIDPDIHVEKTEIINKSIEELYRFVEELEQQVRKDLHRFKPTEETDDTPTIKIKYGVGEIKG
ncbi:hypothetical protein H6F96_28485 [Microcoleus sp. FACHB-53]|jgi:phage-related protein|nr:hypothetical protein [Microcoleus sp. FACHB-53]MBD2130619.1 hypothetical protein [Microcoleus sp. FACHB-1]